VEGLPNVLTHVYMDNLLNSQKLFSVVRTWCVLSNWQGYYRWHQSAYQVECKKAEALKGTTTAAWLVNLKDSPYLLAVCVYDNKPVHVLSMVSESIEWIIKKRHVYH
jgi:hypothetical protein